MKCWKTTVKDNDVYNYFCLNKPLHNYSCGAYSQLHPFQMHQVQCVSPYLAYVCLQFCVVHALTLLCCRCTYMSLLCFSCCFSLFGQHSAAAWILWQQWLVGTKDQGTQVSHMLYALIFCLLLCESGSEQIDCVCARVCLLCQICCSYSAGFQYQDVHFKFACVLQTAGTVMHDNW